MNDGYGIIVYCYVCWNKQKYLKIVIIAAYVVHHLSLRPLYCMIIVHTIAPSIIVFVLVFSNQLKIKLSDNTQ